MVFITSLLRAQHETDSTDKSRQGPQFCPRARHFNDGCIFMWQTRGWAKQFTVAVVQFNKRLENRARKKELAYKKRKWA